jgi:hypothetical protein
LVTIFPLLRPFSESRDPMNAGRAALIIYSANPAIGEQNGVIMGMRPIVIGMICAAFIASVGMGSAGYAQRIREDDLRSHIKILASDEFEGREPGTPGEQKTIAYIMQQWQKAGLSAAAHDGSWLQPVPLIRRGPAAATLQFHAKGNKLRFADDEAVLIGREASITVTGITVTVHLTIKCTNFNHVIQIFNTKTRRD